MTTEKEPMMAEAQKSNRILVISSPSKRWTAQKPIKEDWKGI